MTTDVLVLGAGIVGVSTALALRQRGHRVLLLDRQAPGRETSYGNAGIIQREAVRPYAFPREWRKLLQVALGRGNDVRYHLGAALGLAPRLARYWMHSSARSYAQVTQDYARLIAHCLSEHQVWIERAGVDALVARRGWVQAFRRAPLMALAGRDAEVVARDFGLGCELLDEPGLRRVQPALRASAMAGAVHWTDPWTVSDPGELVAGYARLFGQMGGEFVQGDAASLRAGGAGWSVQAEGGRVDAAQAVIALGPWADGATRALGYRLPLFVKRGYHRHYSGGAALTMPLLDVEQGVMLAPMRRGIRITTGAEFAPFDAPATPLQLLNAERSSRELLDLGTPVEPQPWLGARPCTVDMRPVVGPAPRHRGLWFNFGHGHQGFTLGPVTGRLLAEMMDGETPFVDPTPYLPSRFAP